MARRDGRRVLIYGAGDGGELLLREIQNNGSLGLIPVGFVDDDPTKVGRVIHGIRVIASSDRLSELLPNLNVAEIVVSSAKVDQGRLAALTALCRERDVACRRARFQFE
jgi:UDP-GlcNAc:undecaprenyl-phosphate GlcNAc-1-phosphate transferase